MPATTNDSTTAGPALSAAAWPVSTKIPVPMMAPTPSSMRSIAPSARLSPRSSAASERRVSIDLVAKSGLAISNRGAEHRHGSVDHRGDDRPLDGDEGERAHQKSRNQDGRPVARRASRIQNSANAIPAA